MFLGAAIEQLKTHIFHHFRHLILHLLLQRLLLVPSLYDMYSVVRMSEYVHSTCNTNVLYVKSNKSASQIYNMYLPLLQPSPCLPLLSLD